MGFWSGDVAHDLVDGGDVRTVKNVVNSGARADGFINDAPAILTAHAAAREGVATFLPKGTYAIASSLAISKANTRISGEHRDTTILKITVEPTTGAVFQADSSATDLGSLIVENLTIDMQGGNPALGGYGFFHNSRVWPFSSVTFRNVLFLNPGYHGVCFWLVGAQNVTIEHCEAYGTSTRDGSFLGEFLRMTGCKNITVSYCSGRMLASGINGDGANEKIRITGWDWDGCCYTGPSTRSNSGAQVTYGSTDLTDTSIVNWSTTCAGFPAGGMMARALETRVSGTVKSIDSSRRHTLRDSAVNFTAQSILEQELVRSPSVNPVWEANVIKNGLDNGVLHHDGWRRVDTGEFGIGPEVGDTYTVHRLILAFVDPGHQAGNVLGVARWFGMDGTTHVPANGSRYEIAPQSIYGCHVASNGTGTTSVADNWYMLMCTGKRTLGDPYSFWDPATLIGCYSEWSVDTCFTFNADDGVVAIGCTAYNAGAEAFIFSSVNSVKGRHRIIGCTARKWGWVLDPATNVAAAFRVFGIGMHMSDCHAYAENSPNALKAFEVSAIDSQVLDCQAHDIYPGNIDLQVYAGAPDSLANTLIRGRHRVLQTIPVGSFLGAPIWDLRTPQPVNGGIAGQVGSKAYSEFDKRHYVKSTGTGKFGWQRLSVEDPPDFSPITVFGAPAVVSWVRVHGHVNDVGGVANSVDDQGLMVAHPPTALSAGQRMAYAADAAFNGRTMLTMTAGKGMFADWGGTQINGSTDMTLIIVGRVQNAGGSGGFGYVVTGKTDDHSSYARSGTAANFLAGNAYSRTIPAILGNLPMITVIVWDRANGVTKRYENDATAPLTTDGAPGTDITNFITLGCNYSAGAGGYYAEGVLGEVIRLNVALTADEVYQAMVGLSVFYGLEITT